MGTITRGDFRIPKMVRQSRLAKRQSMYYRMDEGGFVPVFSKVGNQHTISGAIHFIYLTQFEYASHGCHVISKKDE